MQLNHDCVRDVLLYVEENANYNVRISTNSIKLKDYSIEEIVYTIEKLSEADFLNMTSVSTMGKQIPGYIVKSITYKGHEFLDNIKDNSVWSDTKKQLSKFSSTSLSIISSVAAQVLSAKIKLHLGL